MTTGVLQMSAWCWELGVGGWAGGWELGWGLGLGLLTSTSVEYDEYDEYDELMMG